MAYGQEYTPELSQEYLASILNPIEASGAADEARARSEGQAAGLVGQAAMGSKVGMAREATARAKSQAIAGFNMDVAGAKRGERLTAEQQAYQSTESAKDRAFREHMAQIGYQYESAARAASEHGAKIRGQQGLVAGIAGSALTAGIGGYFGGLGKAGGTIGSGLVSKYSSFGTQPDPTDTGWDTSQVYG